MLIRAVVSALLAVAILSPARTHSLSAFNHQHQQRSAFNFPGNDDAPPSVDEASGLSLDGLLNRQQFPAGNQLPFGNAPTNFIVTPSTSPGGAQQTCICVPTGSCNSTIVQPGSDLLDLRIVTPGVTVPIVSPTPVSCVAGLQQCCQPGGYQCGARYPPVAGSPTPAAGQAPYGAYPWQAALLGPGDVYVASAALISANTLVTTAHNVALYLNSPNTLRVRLGDWNAAGTNEPFSAQVFNILSITPHPMYNNQNMRNDVAVLRLTQPVALGQLPTIATVCLPSVSFTGSRCWVSGWGRNAFSGGSYQAIMKHVDVPILTAGECSRELQSTRLGAGFVYDTNSFVCAGGEPSKDACTGDGGSPLVCQMGPQWYLAGLVTWGIGCGSSNVPGVYVNIQNYVNWIQSVM